MNEKEYREFVVSKVSPESLDDLELLAALGIAGEAGEVVDVIKKLRFHGHPTDWKYLVSELGDLYFYFTLMLEARGLTLDEIVNWNVTKLNGRYPDGFDSERSMNRV